MRRTIASLCTAFAVSLTGPALAHSGGPLLDMTAPNLFGLSASVAQNAPACRTLLFNAGDYPADPLSIDSITCLDASCDTREIVLCPLTD